jgi:hypothetical protein
VPNLAVRIAASAVFSAFVRSYPQYAFVTDTVRNVTYPYLMLWS